VEANDFWNAQKVIPVVTIQNADHAVKLAETLAGAGLRKIEITLRTPAALQAIEQIAREVPDAIVGAGTVLNISMAEGAVRAGAKFLVSPGVTPGLLSYLKAGNVPFLPGCATVSEAMYLLENDVRVAKFFPAEDSGGINFLKSVSPVLGTLKLCPTGGVSLNNYKNYLELPNIICVGGSWIATSADINAGEWERISANAAAVK
jgi:2-dehydro-3-deoxyphosphogluconate aldolase/(4S)-4-hydroxy-2-oxoglutarate aldolase